MVKRGNTGGGRSRGQGQSILSDVDNQKQEKFKNRLDEFRHQREWSRDTFQRDIKDLDNVIDTVEELITDIQVKIRKLEGKGDYTGEEERIKQEYGKGDLEELKSMGSGSFTPYLKELYDVQKELNELKDQRDQWIAYQGLLQEVAKKKVLQVALSYKNDRIDSEVAERLMDYIDDQNQRFQENAEKDLKSLIREEVSEMRAKVQHLEGEVQKAKNESRRHRRINETLTEALQEETQKQGLVKELKREIEGMKDIYDESGGNDTVNDYPGRDNDENRDQSRTSRDSYDDEDNSVSEDFVDDEPDNRPSPSPEEETVPEPTSTEPETSSSTPEGVTESELDTQFEEAETDEEAEERGEDDDIVEEALAEMEGEDDTDPEDVEVAELRGESVEDQYEELKRVRGQFSDEEWNSMSQSDIADLTDASRPYLINEILESVHEEYGTAFGITDRYNDE